MVSPADGGLAWLERSPIESSRGQGPGEWLSERAAGHRGQADPASLLPWIRSAICGGAKPSKARQPTFEPEWVDAEHSAVPLYTSGSTGKPKGIQHSSGGYLLQAKVSGQVGVRSAG